MKVIVLSGPTASGKTSISIELAKKFGAEIVNFDSLLLYKEISIGTAKPNITEQQSINHHMLNVRSIAHPMNAADYAREALPLIQKLLSEGKLVILVGGSGFYLQALIKGMYDSPSTPQDVAQRSELLYQNDGIAPFLSILKDCDPESFKRYHENDHYRIRRAVEHWWTNGSRLSDERMKKDTDNEILSVPNIHGWEMLHIFLDLPKDEHIKVIEKRTDSMIESGLVEEVKSLLAQGFSGLEKPLQSIGYKEVVDFHLGIYTSIKECRDRIVISTRQLAKSQRTWFKRDLTKIQFHPLEQKELIFAQVEAFLKA